MESLTSCDGRFRVAGADYQPVGFASGVGLRVSASFNGHVKSAKRFSFIEFIKEEKITIILTLLGALGILLLQFVAWKDIRSECPTLDALLCTQLSMTLPLYASPPSVVMHAIWRCPDRTARPHSSCGLTPAAGMQCFRAGA
jgi:hypothetical protein